MTPRPITEAWQERSDLASTLLYITTAQVVPPFYGHILEPLVRKRYKEVSLEIELDGLERLYKWWVTHIPQDVTVEDGFKVLAERIAGLPDGDARNHADEAYSWVVNEVEKRGNYPGLMLHAFRVYIRNVREGRLNEASARRN